MIFVTSMYISRSQELKLCIFPQWVLWPSSHISNLFWGCPQTGIYRGLLVQFDQCRTTEFISISPYVWQCFINLLKVVKLQLIYMFVSLKTKSCHDANFVVTGGVRRYFDPPIYWPRGQYIVTIFWPPSRYFDPPPNIVYKTVLLVMDNY